jgi:phospholipid transport system substrate-binding protein
MKANLLAVLLVIVTAISHAAQAAAYPSYQGSYPGRAPQLDTSSAPAAIVKSGISKLTAFIQSGGAQDRVQAMTFLEAEVAPYFDFAYMTRWAAGPAWRNMSPEQRANMQAQLTSAFMKTLVQKLTTYTNQPIRYFTPRGQGSNDVSVSAWIMQPNGIPTKLDFRFYKSRNGWKIFDVKAAGNSAVVHYRNQFKRLYSYNRQARYQSP